MSKDLYIHSYTPARAGDARTLILLHGTGGNEHEFDRLGAAIDPDAARISLRGDVDEHGMARFFRRHAEGLYDMADLATRTARLAQFIPAVLASHGRDAGQVTAVGYSNGANILANLMFTAPTVVRAAALMHPLIPFDPAPQPLLNGARVLVTSGAQDPIAPAPLTAHLEDYLARQGVLVSRLRHRGGHELRPEEIDAVRAWLAEARTVIPA